jgi:predicted transcriptional regulator
MSNVKITVGGAIEAEASRRFIDAWHRAERGESFDERHLAFESWDALARVLTVKRIELLRYAHQHKVASVRALAKALGRDYSNVHADVQALSDAGLLAASDGGMRADYDAIETKIVISTARSSSLASAAGKALRTGKATPAQIRSMAGRIESERPSKKGGSHHQLRKRKR